MDETGKGSQDSMVNTVTAYGLNKAEITDEFLSKARQVFFSKAPRLLLGSIQPPIQWVLAGSLSRGKLAGT
jgi:hypothetical protein